MRTFCFILCLALPGLGSAQRGVGTRASVALPPAYPTLTLAWQPNPAAFVTVIVSSTNLLLPVESWPVRAVVFNDLTNSVTLTMTNQWEFFRAYSQ